MEKNRNYLMIGILLLSWLFTATCKSNGDKIWAVGTWIYFESGIYGKYKFTEDGRYSWGSYFGIVLDEGNYIVNGDSIKTISDDKNLSTTTLILKDDKLYVSDSAANISYSKSQKDK